MQLLKPIRPEYIATDIDETASPPNAARFIKGLRLTGTRNANLNTGTGASTPSGNNEFIQASVPSNMAAHNLPDLPGVNKTIGSGEFVEVNKIFYCNYNSNGQHGIYMIDSATQDVYTVIVDPILNFSLDPQHAIPAHRMVLKAVYDSDDVESRKLLEMYLIFTDGKNWQRHISVLAAIKTGGFNVAQYPYWKVHAPHFDRAELIDYPVRPPMFCPTLTEIPPVAEDVAKKNSLLDGSVQIAYAFEYTDGRLTVPSPWSLPFTLPQQGCDINKNNLARCLSVTMYAGSPMVERILIYRRFCNGDWTLYDTINKYNTCGDNEPAKINDEFWKRTGPWAEYSYDPNTNTIRYTYCGDKGCSTFSQEEVMRLENDMPITSIAVTAAGDSILLANNKYYYDRIPCETTKMIQLNLTPGVVNEVCPVVQRRIRLYSYMSRAALATQFAYTKGDKDKVMFGGAQWDISIVDAEPDINLVVEEDEVSMFNLNFGTNQGPICYLRGTPYYAIGRQYKVDSAGNKEFIGLLDLTIPSQLQLAEDIMNSGGYFIMQYDFIVPNGKYIATLARHNASVSGDYQATSTYLTGLADSGSGQNPSLINHSKEIEIDVCNGDYDPWRNGQDLFYVFVPRDYKSGTNERWRFIEGYVKEEVGSSVGVELLGYMATEGDPGLFYGGLYTDHNGFYFAFTARGDAKKANVAFDGMFNCVTAADRFRTTGLPANKRGYYPNINVYVADKNGGEFGKHNRILIRGKVTKCGTTTGISGVAVTLTRGQTTYTASDGTFELIAHQNYNGVRNDRIYINAVGSCFFLGCQCECTPVIDYTDFGIACVADEERVYPTYIERQFRIFASSHKTLKGGGRYNVVMTGYDLAGRSTPVSEIDYIEYPTFMERGNYNPSVFSWSLTGPLKLHPDIKYISFSRTENLNFGEVLQWVGDKIEFLDIRGDVIKTTSGAVRARITFQSLNDYNVNNKFSSTTRYQPVAGDRVRIMDDGDGNLFDLTDGFMDYPVLGTNWVDTTVQGDNEPVDDGKSFIIPFDKRLEKLIDKCGFGIELIHQRDCQLENFFFEMCGMYPVNNGEIMNGVTGAVFQTWDTYYINRSLQIEGCAGKAYLHPFESRNISDFYGENCSSNGRVNVKNDNRRQRWYPDDIIKSDEFVNEGGYNGLGTFREKNRKQFKGGEGGGIVAMHAERNIIGVVAQNDWYVLDYNMNVVRVTAQGVVVANLDSNLSDPHQKVGSNYGCAYEHTATVLFFKGKFSWANAANNAWLLSNYNSIEEISSIDNRGWFVDKFNHVNSFNNKLASDKYLLYLMELTSGVDIRNDELHVTFRPRRGLTNKPEDFVNDLREPRAAHQETFVFDLKGMKWRRYGEHVPEFYCIIRNSGNGSEMMTFAGGRPYYHNPKGVSTFNEMYGVWVEPVVQMVYAEDSSKVKVNRSLVVESNNMKWFTDEATTNERNSFSYIPPAYVKLNEGVWYSEFLADMNSYPSVLPQDAFRSMLLDGKRMFGQFLRFRIVALPSRRGEYVELKNVWIRTTASEKSQK